MCFVSNVSGFTFKSDKKLPADPNNSQVSYCSVLQMRNVGTNLLIKERRPYTHTEGSVSGVTKVLRVVLD